MLIMKEYDLGFSSSFVSSIEEFLFQLAYS